LENRVFFVGDTFVNVVQEYLFVGKRNQTPETT